MCGEGRDGRGVCEEEGHLQFRTLPNKDTCLDSDGAYMKENVLNCTVPCSVCMWRNKEQNYYWYLLVSKIQRGISLDDVNSPPNTTKLF